MSSSSRNRGPGFRIAGASHRSCERIASDARTRVTMTEARLAGESEAEPRLKSGQWRLVRSRAAVRPVSLSASELPWVLNKALVERAVEAIFSSARGALIVLGRVPLEGVVIG